MEFRVTQCSVIQLYYKVIRSARNQHFLRILHLSFKERWRTMKKNSYKTAAYVSILVYQKKIRDAVLDFVAYYGRQIRPKSNQRKTL